MPKKEDYLNKADKSFVKEFGQLKTPELGPVPDPFAGKSKKDKASF